jgi:hypothetical protein
VGSDEATGTDAAGTDTVGADSGGGSRLARFDTVERFVLGAIVGIVVRVWLAGEGPPAVWQDSFDYLAVGSNPLWSTELWAGSRPGLVSYLIATLGGELNVNYVVFQVVFAALAWSALAAQVSAVMPTATRRWVAFGVVLAFSWTRPVALWDRSVLSESFGLSLLAATAAAGLWLLRGADLRRLVVFVLAAAAWGFTRDTNAVVVAMLVVGFGGWWALGWRRSRREPVGTGEGSGRAWLAVGAVALAVVLALAAWSSNAGGRHVVPLAHVFAVRVLPYEDRIQWFVDQGMPGLGLPLPVAAPGGEVAPVAPVDLDSPSTETWRSWLDTDGRAALVRYALTHPGYLVGEPLQDPERTFNNGDGDVVATYAPAGSRTVPGLTALLWLPLVPTVAVGVAIAGWYLWRRRRPTPLAIVAATCVVAAGPLAFVAWHADGMETARHLLTPAVLVRLGVLLGVLSLLEVVGLGDATDPSDADRPSGGPEPVQEPVPAGA